MTSFGAKQSILYVVEKYSLNSTNELKKISKHYFDPLKSLKKSHYAHPPACRACSMLLHVILIECCWNESKRDLKNVSETSKVVAEIFSSSFCRCSSWFALIDCIFSHGIVLAVNYSRSLSASETTLLTILQYFVNIDEGELEHQ